MLPAAIHSLLLPVALVWVAVIKNLNSQSFGGCASSFFLRIGDFLMSAAPAFSGALTFFAYISRREVVDRVAPRHASLMLGVAVFGLFSDVVGVPGPTSGGLASCWSVLV